MNKKQNHKSMSIHNKGNKAFCVSAIVRINHSAEMNKKKLSMDTCLYAGCHKNN